MKNFYDFNVTAVRGIVVKGIKHLIDDLKFSILFSGFPWVYEVKSTNIPHMVMCTFLAKS